MEITRITGLLTTPKTNKRAIPVKIQTEGGHPTSPPSEAADIGSIVGNAMKLNITSTSLDAGVIQKCSFLCRCTL